MDKGEYCSLEVFDDPDQAARIHRRGLIRLIRLGLKEQIKYLDKNLKSMPDDADPRRIHCFFEKGFPVL